ncbi:MAG: DUF4810 domain-containing protein [Aestuariibacter sp.]|uniref:DUF4810 domain-containing protein n=1 Tax=Marisediminitalea aggregata TaxID=634436 RepID=UPI0020CF16D3|nr:DUF4810 domain-containing protein [Marisediminitalea aggregata]MCP3866325.1 DUF4810 domain-containing protein [Aestuariibacter sp.]MCP4276693.1 DUF4810 domain-containing protein [Gammaproteobacteria bacterium]MCP4528373.1 DUF4810 domain-containing protein [Aestuariibacter sp.]MCP4945995.1 DUF4810 domain-containing protein [Aestuariibacter sp.]MCP9477203.1 DUF4810 domain-containing protein [Marisediminitalea aggregata]
MKKIILAAAVAIALVGCETTEPQYYYGDYTKAVYSYFKADEVTLEEQINALQLILSTAEAQNKPVAPGFHAHLGMLYFETGNPSLGVQHLETEKSLFPESAKYIDFLLKSAKDA